MQGGRVIGQADRIGGVPSERPVYVQELFATLYRNLGIDTTHMPLHDRPQDLLDDIHRPIRELDW